MPSPRRTRQPTAASLQLPVYAKAARAALGTPTAPVSAEYWFVDHDHHIEVPLTEAVETLFLHTVDVIVGGIAAGLFPHRPPPDDGFGDYIPCRYCDPDGLGAAEHRAPVGAQATRPAPGRLPGRGRARATGGVMTGTAALGDAQARDLIATGLDRTLFVEAGAGSGKTQSLVSRVVATVLDPTAPVPLRHIAAVTFTEKAGAELRDRLRAAFERAACDRRRSWRREALDELDAAAIGTLHSFARRILTEHPIEAALPPLIEVLDEVASGVAFDARYADLRTEILDDASLTPALLLALSAGMKLDDLRSIARAFTSNWDLIAARVLAGPAPALTAVDHRPRARRRPCPGRDGRALPGRQRQAPAAPRPLRADVGRPAGGRPGRPRTGAGAGGPAPGQLEPRPQGQLDLSRRRGEGGRPPAHGRRRAAAGAGSDAALRVLARRVGEATLEHARARRATGRLEFHDLLVLARDLLRSPVHGAAVRDALQDRYRRLLLDEFQDTDPIQIELAVRIAGGVDGGRRRVDGRRGARRAACSSSATRSSRSTGSVGPTSACTCGPSSTSASRSCSTPTSAPARRSSPGSTTCSAA